MTYANPGYLPLFLAIFFLAAFYAWSLRRRRKIAERFIDKSLMKGMASALSPGRRAVKIMLISVSVWLAVFSLMRPQWGFRWEEMKRHGLDIMIAMDVSKSMLAQDVKPNRLERSKLAVQDMVAKLKSDRVGLIAFAGTSFLQCPLTSDYSGFLLALGDLDTETIPQPGTAITSAIKAASKILEGADKKFKVLVVITDGEDHEGDALRASLEAAKEGLKIFCVGVGTKEGEIIPVVDERGSRGYLKDKAGKVVKSSLNENALQEIALNTGGAYIRATGAEFGLNTLYDQKISKLEKREFESQMRKQYIERFQVFLGIAIILLFLEPFVRERR